MDNAFKTPPKGTSFKPKTQKTLNHKFSKDLSKRAAPTGNQGAKALKGSNATLGLSPKLSPAFPPYNGRR